VSDIPFRVEGAAVAGPVGLQRTADGRVRLTVRAGEQRTGGHAFSVRRIRRDGSRLVAECILRGPTAGAIVTQVLTAPTETVSMDAALVEGVRLVVLVDPTGAELARISA